MLMVMQYEVLAEHVYILWNQLKPNQLEYFKQYFLQL